MLSWEFRTARGTAGQLRETACRRQSLPAPEAHSLTPSAQQVLPGHLPGPCPVMHANYDSYWSLCCSSMTPGGWDHCYPQSMERRHPKKSSNLPQVTLLRLVPDPRSKLSGMEEYPATQGFMAPSLCPPCSSPQSLLLPRCPHHPLDVAPATSVGTNSCLCLPQYLWGLGRQGWCPAHLWASGGGANEQPMNRYVFPRQTQGAQRMYPQLRGQRDPGSPQPQGNWQCPMTSSLFLGVEASSPLFPPPLGSAWGPSSGRGRVRTSVQRASERLDTQASFRPGLPTLSTAHMAGNKREGLSLSCSGSPAPVFPCSPHLCVKNPYTSPFLSWQKVLLEPRYCQSKKPNWGP